MWGTTPSGGIDRRSSLVSFFGGKSTAEPFGTFATKSAHFGPRLPITQSPLTAEIFPVKRPQRFKAACDNWAGADAYQTDNYLMSLGDLNRLSLRYP
jgi:hypothetical protein